MFYCTSSCFQTTKTGGNMVVQSVKGLFCHPVWRFVFVHQTIRTHRRAGGPEKDVESVHAHDAPEGQPSTVFTHFTTKRFLPDSCEGVSCCCWAVLFSLSGLLEINLQVKAALELVCSPWTHLRTCVSPPPSWHSLSFHFISLPPPDLFSTQFLPSANFWLSAALCLARPVLYRSGIFFFLKPLKMAEFCESGNLS